MASTPVLSSADALAIISKAWGKQEGYCFFPTIRGDAKDKPERIQSYSEGQGFFWPKDKAKIIAHMDKNRHNDLYWCPSLFEYDRRREDVAMDEHALWADLDEVDPNKIDQRYRPTIAWETSPGRYQGLWIISGGDIQGASWEGRENKRLTYYLGADKSGWDTTQLLRVPGWDNHKPEYRGKDGSPAPGKLLWKTGRRYLADEFNELPVLEMGTALGDILEDSVNAVDRLAVWARVKLKVTKRIRDLYNAKSASGDRSDALWEMERDLADAGCTAVEIVAIVRGTVWNKYLGRSDEFQRLATEASKALAEKSEDAGPSTEDALEEIRERGKPQNLFDLVKDLKPPKWLIRGVLTEGAVGFIAGQPKNFKSWFGLDMVLSVASGQPFLGHFDIVRPGPTLYIQEEDSAPLVKTRLGKVWPGKLGDKISMENGEIVWLPGQEVEGNPPVDAYIGQGVVVSDEVWQLWLDETLAEKAEEIEGGYRLVVIDTLMMVAGDVEENRAQEMTTKIFRPLKELARKHHCCIVLVHHMRKVDPKAGSQRGGQMMLGSVANHAWAEDSLYLKIGRMGAIVVEQESKNAPVGGFTVTGIRNKSWSPGVKMNADQFDEQQPDPDETRSFRSAGGKKGGAKPGESRSDPNKTTNASLRALYELGLEAQSVKTICEAANTSPAAVYQGFKRHQEKGWVEKVGTKFRITAAGIKALE